VASRLVYLMRPAPRSFPNPIRVRRINDELELVEYYRLRHRVYEMMGYISNQKECVPSRMEIDGCDPTSLHLGAYEQLNGYCALAGTARVVFMNGDDSLSTVNGFRWTNHLLENDPRLKVLVQREQLPNGLPVFQSQNLNEHLHEAIRDRLHCAELSRVIVHPDYRGAQLSTKLVEHAISEAQQNKVDRLYLECLDVHESLYAKHGFQTIPNTRGLVVGVGRNMIAMVRDTRGEANQKPKPR
jgi:predicted GNAT family N-acyltransferase